MKRVKILEVDQWAATDNIEGAKFKGWSGHGTVCEVLETAKPPKGYVWFKPDKKGILKLWKSNYESSD